MIKSQFSVCGQSYAPSQEGGLLFITTINPSQEGGLLFMQALCCQRGEYSSSLSILTACKFWGQSDA
jgi:hypothetical protein